MPIFEEEFLVNAQQEDVWAFLLDPKQVSPCMPGCESVEMEDDVTYRVLMTVKVGFLRTTQRLRMTLTEVDPPRRLVAVGRGEDRRLGSNIEVQGVLELKGTAEGATLVRYQSKLQVVGRLSAIGDAVMKKTAKHLTECFVSNVRAAIEGVR
jgi:carbon monoxide dehydrogenase subunit G